MGCVGVAINDKVIAALGRVYAEGKGGVQGKKANAYKRSGKEVVYDHIEDDLLIFSFYLKNLKEKRL